MPLTFEMSHQSEPKFPPCCVVCGNREPDSATTVATSAWHPRTLFASEGAPQVSFRVPACGKCGWMLFAASLLKWAIPFAVVMLGVFVAIPYLKPYIDVHRMRIALILAAMGVAFVPWYFWDWLFPLPLEVTTDERFIIFHIKDSKYWDEFAELNDPIGFDGL